MGIRVSCPNCNTVLNAPETAAGKKGRCPKCKATLSVPAGATGERAKPGKPASVRPKGIDGALARPVPASRRGPGVKGEPSVQTEPAGKAEPVVAQAGRGGDAVRKGRKVEMVLICAAAAAVVALACAAGFVLRSVLGGRDNATRPPARENRTAEAGADEEKTDGRENVNWGAALRSASMRQDSRQVKWVLERGDFTQEYLNESLRDFVVGGEGEFIEDERDAVKMLARKGADINALKLGGDGGSVLHRRMVFFSGKRMARAPAELLVEIGADVNARDSDGLTPLHYAIRSHQPRAGRDLLEDAIFLILRGAQINAKDKYGATPLHRACEKGEDYMPASFVEFMISKGADVNASDLKGVSALHIAGSAAKAKLLIEQGAEIEARASDGGTPLHFTQVAEVAEVLIEHGADVNAKDNNGATPLHRKRSAEMVQLLIAKGADVNARDKSGFTPLATAEQKLAAAPGVMGRSYREIAELLKEHGATK